MCTRHGEGWGEWSLLRMQVPHGVGLWKGMRRGGVSFQGIYLYEGGGRKAGKVLGTYLVWIY